MRLLTVLLLAAVCALPSLPAETSPIVTGWDRIHIAPMKTSIYVGSVSLTTGMFERKDSTLSTTYVAKVVPWFFWGENGKITITLSDVALANLAKGERAEFTGDAANHKNKPRKVTGYAQPADATSGKIKVRILADGLELIFNSTYKFEEAKNDRPAVQ